MLTLEVNNLLYSELFHQLVEDDARVSACDRLVRSECAIVVAVNKPGGIACLNMGIFRMACRDILEVHFLVLGILEPFDHLPPVGPASILDSAHMVKSAPGLVDVAVKHSPAPRSGGFDAVIYVPIFHDFLRDITANVARHIQNCDAVHFREVGRVIALSEQSPLCDVPGPAEVIAERSGGLAVFPSVNDGLHEVVAVPCCAGAVEVSAVIRIWLVVAVRDRGG